MLGSLVLPLDGSEFSERVLPLAETLASRTGAQLHLAHVHVPHAPDHFLSNTQFQYEGLDLDEYEERYRAREREYLGNVGSGIDGGSHVDAEILEGDIAGEIAAYAKRVGADMILITTHGHTGLSRMWLGSVADALVRTTTLPLLIVHPTHGGQVPGDLQSIRHMLIPLDGSELSATILAPATELALAAGARITLAHVVSGTAVLGARIFPLMPDDTVGAVERADEYLESVAGPLRQRGLKVDTFVGEHDAPGRAIAAIAEKLDADLIAMATHGYGGLKRALLGSVADKILRSSPLPLLVQRPAG